MAAVVTPTDTSMQRAELERAWHMMRSYLSDCAAQKVASSKHCTEELSGVIRACVERLVVDRRQCCPIPDPRLPLDALDYALRFIDEHLDARLESGRLAFNSAGRRFATSTGMASREPVISRLRRATKLFRDGATSLAHITLETGRSCQSHLARWFRQRPEMAVRYARIHYVWPYHRS